VEVIDLSRNAGCLAIGKTGFVGKLNDLGKNRKLPGISQKEGKSGNFIQSVFLKSKIAKSVFFIIYLGKYIILFKLLTIYKIYLLNFISWGGVK